MRILGLIALLALAGCSGGVDMGKTSDLHSLISTRDITLNRPDTTIPEAAFRLHPDGTGTVHFLRNPDSAQPILWSLTQGQFCLDAAEGLIASFGCATLRANGSQITLTHGPSGKVATGTLNAR